MFSEKVTVALAPGVRFTRWNPLSCSGGSSLAAGSPTYICATSAPATDPVLVIFAVRVERADRQVRERERGVGQPVPEREQRGDTRGLVPPVPDVHALAEVDAG